MGLVELRLPATFRPCTVSRYASTIVNHPCLRHMQVAQTSNHPIVQLRSDFVVFNRGPLRRMYVYGLTRNGIPWFTSRMFLPGGPEQRGGRCRYGDMTEATHLS